jgi:hypothetical protein
VADPEWVVRVHVKTSRKVSIRLEVQNRPATPDLHGELVWDDGPSAGHASEDGSDRQPKPLQIRGSARGNWELEVPDDYPSGICRGLVVDADDQAVGLAVVEIF